MRWRHLREGETDHELVWLFVSIGCAVFFIAWFGFGLPWPACNFHEFTGLACPTCGMTRCARFILVGDFPAAFAINPLGFLTYAGIAVFDIYAATVLALKLPRLRIDAVQSRTGRWIRVAVIAIVAMNWVWLIAKGV